MAPGSPPTVGPLAYHELDDALGLTTVGVSPSPKGAGQEHPAPAARAARAGGLRPAGRLRGRQRRRAARPRSGHARRGRPRGHGPVGRLEQRDGPLRTEWLATEANLAALSDLSGTWIDRVHQRRPPDGIVLTWTARSPTFGQQEDLAGNGHFRCTCYHPLFLVNQFGDLERCLLLPGHIHSAEDWRTVLEPVLGRCCERGLKLYFRGHAAFAKPELYELLKAEEIEYAIRLPANCVLQARTCHPLTRPVGRPPRKPQVFHASFSYRRRAGASRAG